MKVFPLSYFFSEGDEERRRSLATCVGTKFPMMSRDGVLHRVLEFCTQVFYLTIITLPLIGYKLK